MKNFLSAFPLLLLVLSIASCKKDSDPNAALKSSIKTNYIDMAGAAYEDAYIEAVNLKAAIDAFVANPDQTNFDNARTAWLDAREPYGQTEAFRFAGGPIDDEDGPEGLINAWPLDETYIDGIIAGNTAITKSYLQSLNEQGGEANISVGYHALEYLLWGQDLTAPSALLPGQRAYTDFVGNGTTETRRRAYLQTVAELLVDDLQSVSDDFNGSYRTAFLALDNNEALTRILTGIGVLSKSELAGERIFTAYDNQDQEDEHSCFSDNTHRDIRLNISGIKNVYTGSYTRVSGAVVSGASLSELLTKIDADFSATVSADLTDAVNKVYATGIPFDNAITDGTQRPKVLDAVNSLRTLGDKFAEAGQKLGLVIDTNLPG